MYSESLKQHLDNLKRSKGFGDMVASVATPIAKALKLSCIDPKTKKLRPESRCNKTRTWLNKL